MYVESAVRYLSAVTNFIDNNCLNVVLLICMSRSLSPSGNLNVKQIVRPSLETLLFSLEGDCLYNFVYIQRSTNFCEMT